MGITASQLHAAVTKIIMEESGVGVMWEQNPQPLSEMALIRIGIRLWHDIDKHAEEAQIVEAACILNKH